MQAVTSRTSQVLTRYGPINRGNSLFGEASVTREFLSRGQAQFFQGQPSIVPTTYGLQYNQQSDGQQYRLHN